MAWERYEQAGKRGAYTNSPACRIGKVGIYINEAACLLLNGADHVELWFDRQTRRVGLNPKENSTGYKLNGTGTRGNGRQLSCRAFLRERSIPTDGTRRSITVEDGMLVFDTTPAEV